MFQEKLGKLIFALKDAEIARLAKKRALGQGKTFNLQVINSC